MIRFYCDSDIESITKLGSQLHNNYKFKLDTFSKCIVLIKEEKLIGFAVYSLIYERAELIDIIINVSNRKKGYGKKLLDFVLRDAISNKCENITLEVCVNNMDAINLYSNMGFKKIRLIKNYYFNKKCNQYFDGYIMELKF